MNTANDNIFFKLIISRNKNESTNILNYLLEKHKYDDPYFIQNDDDFSNLDINDNKLIIFNYYLNNSNIKQYTYFLTTCNRPVIIIIDKCIIFPKQIINMVSNIYTDIITNTIEQLRIKTQFNEKMICHYFSK